MPKQAVGGVFFGETISDKSLCFDYTDICSPGRRIDQVYMVASREYDMHHAPSTEQTTSPHSTDAGPGPCTPQSLESSLALSEVHCVITTLHAICQCVTKLNIP